MLSDDILTQAEKRGKFKSHVLSEKNVEKKIVCDIESGRKKKSYFVGISRVLKSRCYREEGKIAIYRLRRLEKSVRGNFLSCFN
jgi:hypothetical protein